MSQELGDPSGAVGTPSSLVGYSVRLENYISRNTRLAYVTYGIALRMLEGSGKQGIAFDEITVGRSPSPDPHHSHWITFVAFSTSSLTKYCLALIHVPFANERKVHERNIESDFLLIVLKALLAKRPDLR